MTKSRTVWFGWVTFAAVMLVVLGLLNVLEGLVALLQNQVAFIDGDSLVVVNLTGWGILMLAFGGLLLAAGIGLMARNTVARVAAIVIVALHMLIQVGWLGAYPVWSLLMITLSVVVLFALTVHWSESLPPVTAPAGLGFTAGQPPGGPGAAAARSSSRAITRDTTQARHPDELPDLAEPPVRAPVRCARARRRPDVRTERGTVPAGRAVPVGAAGFDGPAERGRTPGRAGRYGDRRPGEAGRYGDMRHPVRHRSRPVRRHRRTGRASRYDDETARWSDPPRHAAPTSDYGVI